MFILLTWQKQILQRFIFFTFFLFSGYMGVNNKDWFRLSSYSNSINSLNEKATAAPEAEHEMNHIKNRRK